MFTCVSLLRSKPFPGLCFLHSKSQTWAISLPYKTSGQISGLYILMCRVLESGRDDNSWTETQYSLPSCEGGFAPSELIRYRYNVTKKTKDYLLLTLKLRPSDTSHSETLKTANFLKTILGLGQVSVHLQADHEEALGTCFTTIERARSQWPVIHFVWAITKNLTDL